jgi:ribonuclease HI
MHIEAYSDGSATTSEKPGGWGYVLVIDGVKHSEGKGHMPGASNNDAEMEAAIQGLAAVLKYLNDWVTGEDGRPLGPLPDANVTLVSDSQLILGWASGVYRFKQADKYAKYKQLEFLVKRLDAKTRHVKGHSGDEHNERCDKLANLGRLQKEEELKSKPPEQTLIGTKKTGTLCVWYNGILKVIDLDSNVIENHDRITHGTRGGILEIREDKSR